MKNNEKKTEGKNDSNSTNLTILKLCKKNAC